MKELIIHDNEAGQRLDKLLRKYPDAVTVKDVVTLTGYTLTTVHSWCSRGSLKAFQK